jgi:hypothetical protein
MVPTLSRSLRTCCLRALLMLCTALPVTLTSDLLCLPSAADSNIPIAAQRPGKTASPQVRSAMALLAALEQAQVLPPEGSKEADQIIKSVIQFQSLFAKSTNAAVQDFMRRTLMNKQGAAAANALAQFRADGWTPEMLEALAGADQPIPSDELRSMATGFEQFNLSVNDFQRFTNLIREGERTLSAQGHHLHEVYAALRKTMPGSANE